MPSYLSSLLSLSLSLGDGKKRGGHGRERASGGIFLAREREGEDGTEELKWLQTCTSPQDRIFLRRERVRGKREKERVQKQRKWGAWIFSCLEFRRARSMKGGMGHVLREKESLREERRRGSWTEGRDGHRRVQRWEEKTEGKERCVVGERGREERMSKRERGERRRRGTLREREKRFLPLGEEERRTQERERERDPLFSFSLFS